MGNTAIIRNIQHTVTCDKQNAQFFDANNSKHGKHEQPTIHTSPFNTSPLALAGFVHRTAEPRVAKVAAIAEISRSVAVAVAAEVAFEC